MSPRVLVFAVFVASSAAQSPCRICGPGRVVGSPGVIFAFPGQPEVSCGLLEEIGTAGGLIEDGLCDLLRPLVVNICSCVPGDSGITAPTFMPFAPVANPTFPVFSPPTLFPKIETEMPVSTAPVIPLDSPTSQMPVSPALVIPPDSPTTPIPVALSTVVPVVIVVPTDAPILATTTPIMVPTDDPLFPTPPPITSVPVSPAPVTPAPVTLAPVTLAPVTAAPSSSPSTEAPSVRPVVIPAPAPITAAPNTPVSSGQAPVEETGAPATSAPVITTPAPTPNSSAIRMCSIAAMLVIVFSLFG